MDQRPKVKQEMLKILEENMTAPYKTLVQEKNILNGTPFIRDLRPTIHKRNLKNQTS